MSALFVLWLQGIQCLEEEAQLGEEEGHWIQFQILCEKQEMCISEMILNVKVLKSENSLRSHLVDLVSAVLVEVVVAGPFLLMAPFFVDIFLFFFFCVALATVSLCGKTISDVVVDTTMRLSVLQVDAFLRFVFGGPLK